MLRVILFSALFYSHGLFADIYIKPLLARSVVKVIADSGDRQVSMGSGVVVAPNRVATNCHVTRKARAISVLKGSIRYQATAQSAEPELDLCLLHMRNMQIPGVPIGTIADSKVGDEVVVYGYPRAIGLSMHQGIVKALHPYGTSLVIETDAGFVGGSSGGGLFNAKGQLIGFTTFLRRDERGRFYAIPADWLDKVSGREGEEILPFKGKLPFWQTDSFTPKMPPSSDRL